MSTTTDLPTITVEDEQTFRIYAPRGSWVDGGLSPSSLAIGDGRVLLGWVERSDESPDVYFMPSIDECGWEVYQAPVHNDADPVPLPDENGPVGTLETRPAWEQLETLRSNIKAALDYANTTPPPAPDRFTLGYSAARRYYGDGAARTLTDIRAAATAVQDEHPDGPAFYTELLDLIERRTREWARP